MSAARTGSALGVAAGGEHRLSASWPRARLLAPLYLSLGKPRIVGLVLLAAVVGYVVATGGAISVSVLGLLVLAGGMSAFGAAMVNNYLERDADALMERTRERPLANAAIRRPERVFQFGLLLVAAGCVVGLLIGPLVSLTLAAGAFVYVVLYTILLKRRTHWSVVVGGISGSCAVLAGWFAGAPPSLAVLPLAVLLLVWQAAHFWPLALARPGDYERASIPTLPSVVGPRRASVFVFMASLATVGVSLGAGAAAGYGTLYAAGSGITGTLWLILNGRLLADPGVEMAWRLFKASGAYLVAVLLLMMFASFLTE